MPDIRDVLKGLSPDDRASYMEARNIMRRAYLAAHARVLPLDKFEVEDDQFMDLIDIRLALLYDRGGVFNAAEGHIEKEQAETIEETIKESAATKWAKEGLAAANGGWSKQ